MQLPDLSPLPVWAQLVVYGTLGISLAVIIAVARLGILQGQKSTPANNPASAQVAAVIVDPTALNHASAAVEGLTVAVTEATKVGREHAKNMERMAEEMDKVREEMRIQREVNRGR
ncbi:MAG TPA: hypothetical protein VFT61_02555 [Sphingomicrobium sp.]|nr:hypothetical protein [Sphingomicrobium sp.]